MEVLTTEIEHKYRYFMYLAYDGSSFHGWQIQQNAITVQEVITDALNILLKEKVELVGAGRTDTGVSASFFVAHFDVLHSIEDLQFIIHKLNRILPPSISIYKIRSVKPKAHARFDALSRTYTYHIHQYKDPFLRASSWHRHEPLNVNKMQEASNLLFNYVDFTSFSKLHTDVLTNNCKIYKAEWNKTGSKLVFTISADRFLRSMVRSIVGTLFEVGRDNLSIEGFGKIIEDKNRKFAGQSAPAHALFLRSITYPTHIFMDEDANLSYFPDNKW